MTRFNLLKIGCLATKTLMISFPLRLAQFVFRLGRQIYLAFLNGIRDREHGTRGKMRGQGFWRPKSGSEWQLANSHLEGSVPALPRKFRRLVAAS